MGSIGQSIHLNDSMQLVICDISTTPDILQHYWLEHCMEAGRHSRLDEHLVLEAAGVDLRQHQHALCLSCCVEQAALIIARTRRRGCGESLA